MRKLHSILLITLLVCVVGVVVFLILSPDQIPVHFNFSGEMDRIGSKYEFLVFPAIEIGIGLFFLLMSKIEQKKGENSNERVVMLVGIGVTILLMLVGFYFMVKAIHYDPENPVKLGYDDTNKLIGVGIGALLVVLGNIMPKARRNSMFGIRTSWSMYNDSVWQKSQRIGGIASVIGGFVLIILSLLLPGSWNTVVMLVVITILVIFCAGASYHFYSAERASGL